MKIIETARFRKSFAALDSRYKKKVKKQFQLFLKNPRYPSLNTEKLAPKENNIWSFRIDRKYRVIFTFQGADTILVLDLGPHDIYRRQ